MQPDRDLAARLGLAGPTADDARRTGADRIVAQAFGRGSARSNLEGSPLEGSREPPAPPAAYHRSGDGILGSLIGLSYG